MPRTLMAFVVLCLLVCNQSESGGLRSTAQAAQMSLSDQQAALESVNRARASARICQDNQQNKGRFVAVKAVTWNNSLEQAARAHAQDMIERHYFAHQHPQGPNLQMRLEQVGYRWQAIGENIAAGQPTLAAVVSAWLGSAGHCAIIMGAQFSEMGLARVDGLEGSPYKVYWVLDFAAPLAQR